MNEERFFKELGREVDSCFDNVNDALRALWSIREDVKETHKNCNISKTVGTSVKGLGVLHMVAGIACPPLAIFGGIAAVAGTTTNVTTEVIRKVENDGYGSRLKRVVENINYSNDKLKATAAKCKSPGDGNFNFPNIGTLCTTNNNLCSIQQLEAYVKREIKRGDIMAACGAIVAVTAAVGLTPVAVLGAAGACILLGVDIVNLIDDWNREPPLQEDIDKYIAELLRMKEILETYKGVINLALKNL